MRVFHEVPRLYQMQLAACFTDNQLS